jgi:hypothetical protein
MVVLSNEFGGKNSRQFSNLSSRKSNPIIQELSSSGVELRTSQTNFLDNAVLDDGEADAVEFSLSDLPVRLSLLLVLIGVKIPQNNSCGCLKCCRKHRAIRVCVAINYISLIISNLISTHYKCTSSLRYVDANKPPCLLLVTQNFNVLLRTLSSLIVHAWLLKCGTQAATAFHLSRQTKLNWESEMGVVVSYYYTFLTALALGLFSITSSVSRDQPFALTNAIFAFIFGPIVYIPSYVVVLFFFVESRCLRMKINSFLSLLEKRFSLKVLVVFPWC